MQLICSYCGRDLNEIWQCNMSYSLNTVCCEDCAGYHEDHVSRYDDEYLEYKHDRSDRYEGWWK